MCMHKHKNLHILLQRLYHSCLMFVLELKRDNIAPVPIHEVKSNQERGVPPGNKVVRTLVHIYSMDCRFIRLDSSSNESKRNEMSDFATLLSTYFLIHLCDSHPRKQSCAAT